MSFDSRYSQEMALKYSLLFLSDRSSGVIEQNYKAKLSMFKILNWEYFVEKKISILIKK